MIARLFDKLLLTLEDSNLAFQEEKLQLFVKLLHLHLLIQYSLKPGGLPYSLHLATSLLLLAAFLLCLKPAYSRVGICLSTASLSIMIGYHFPFNHNHLYLEFLCLVLLALLSIREPEPRQLLLASLKYVMLVTLFYTGLQKCFYGTYNEAEYLGYTIAQKSRFTDLFTFLLPSQEVSRLTSLNPQLLGAGPFSVSYFPVVALSNLVYILEMGLPFLLIPARTRLGAALFSMLFISALQLGAREVFFAGLFVMLGSLYLESRRMVRSIYAFVALIYLAWPVVHFAWPDIFIN